MAVIVQNCPLNTISDGIISFLQFEFKTPESVPDEYRWSPDDRATKIFISGPFTITRDKVGALPTITIIRGPFSFENRGIDNQKGADTNTFENPEYLDIMRGNITVICEAGTSSEATGLANFVALEIQANRHELKKHMNFLHRIIRTTISQENPVKEAAEIERWQCGVTFDVSLYSGWMKKETGLSAFRKASIFNGVSEWTSMYGEYIQGADEFIDNSANFGVLTTHKPQLLQTELEKGWYFITLGSDSPKRYVVEEILDSKRLRLSQFDADGIKRPFSPESSQTNVSYKLLWNTIHIGIEIKK